MQQKIENLQQQFLDLKPELQQSQDTKQVKLSYVSTNIKRSYDMLDLDGVTSGRIYTLANSYKSNDDLKVNLGGLARTYAFKRAINGSSTTSHNGAGLNSLYIALIAHQADFTFYTDLGYQQANVEQLLGNLSSQTVSSMTINQALMAWHPVQTSWYITGGRGFVDFGQFNNVVAFNNPFTRQFFAPFANHLSFAFKSHGFSISTTAINDANDLNVHQSQVNERNMINFAANLSYLVKLSSAVNLKVGTGFLRYADFSKTSLETSPSKFNPSPAIDVNAGIYSRIVDLTGEYVATTSDTDLSQASDKASLSNKKINAWDVGIAVHVPTENVVFKGLSLNTDYSQLNYENNFTVASFNELAKPMKRYAVGISKRFNPYVSTELSYITQNNSTWDSNDVLLRNNQKIVLLGLTAGF